MCRFSHIRLLNVTHSYGAVCLSVCCLLVCLSSACLSVRLSVCLPVCQSVRPSVVWVLLPLYSCACARTDLVHGMDVSQFLLLQAYIFLFCAARSVSIGQIYLVYDYPLAENFSRVELRCSGGAETLTSESIIFQDAQFLRGGEVITRENVLGYARTNEGVLSFTIRPKTEGTLTCRHDGETSNAVALAGK